MLYAMEITEGRSDTMFCNMYAAYEGLSDGLKKVLDGLTAMHSAELLVREVPSRLSVKEAPSAVQHPVVRTHPGTGRKALYVNPHYTTHRSEEHPSELQSLMRISYAVFWLKKKKKQNNNR